MTQEKTVVQDTIVPIKTQIAKLVIKDLIKGDGAIVEVKELNKVIGLKDEQIRLFKEKDLLKLDFKVEQRHQN